MDPCDGAASAPGTGGPGTAGADMIEMDRPPLPWERYLAAWQRRWRERGRLTRAAIASAALLLAAAGAATGYAATRPAAPRAAPRVVGRDYPAPADRALPQAGPATQLLWANGPRGKPWAVVSTGAVILAAAVQIGTVAAVRPASLTVTGPGGRATTYAVAPVTQVNFRGDKLGSVRDGQRVDVIAAREGKTLLALVIETIASSR
jgi:hypothetical protein